MDGRPFSISARAREYALRELVRRVAPADAFLAGLRIDVRSDETRLVLPFGEVVVFPHAPSAHVAALATARGANVIARPLAGCSSHELPFAPRNVVVPFLHESSAHGAPLFRVTGSVAHCSVDLVASTLRAVSSASRTRSRAQARLRHGSIARSRVRRFAYSGDIVIPRFDYPEPLRVECRHFVDCVTNGRTPLTDGEEALRVVATLEAAQTSLERGGEIVRVTA